MPDAVTKSESDENWLSKRERIGIVLSRLEARHELQDLTDVVLIAGSAEQTRTVRHIACSVATGHPHGPATDTS